MARKEKRVMTACSVTVLSRDALPGGDEDGGEAVIAPIRGGLGHVGLELPRRATGSAMPNSAAEANSPW